MVAADRSADHSVSLPLPRGASPLWRRALGYAGGAVLGAVLLLAAWAKATDPEAFIELIRAERLDFLLSAKALAFLVLGLEVGLGLALVLGLRRWWVLVPAAVLVAAFLALNGRTWYLEAHGLRQEAASCGCFGNLVERTPAEAFWQDLALLMPPLLLAFLARPRAGPRATGLKLAAAALAAVASVIFAVRAPSLPLDDLATRLHPGARTAELCTGRGAERVCLGQLVIGELAQGEHLVVIADLADPSIGPSVEAWNAHARSGAGPRLWMLTASQSEEVRKFDWTYAPAFEVREAPPALLRPLYRRLPRSFVVRDGVVIRTQPGMTLPSELAG